MLSIVLAAGATLGCGDQTTQEDIWTEASPLNVTVGGNTSLWPNGSVQVCLSPAPGMASSDLEGVRTRIRQTLGEGWGRAANLTFWDFSNCPSGTLTNRVKVTFDTSISNSSNVVGRLTNGLNVVNFQWNSNFAFAPNPDLILHEFGHAIGFAHEQSRPGYVPVNSTCPAETTVNGNPQGTPLDGISIMIHTGGCMVASKVLSPWDIVGVQNLYGRKKQGVIVGLNNECINIPNGTSPPLGLDLQVFDCSSGTNEIWRWSTIDRKLTGANVNNGNNAMDIEGATAATNTPIQMFSSLGTQANQAWNFNGVRMLTMGNLCVDLPAGENRVQIFTCNGGQNQNWDVLPVPSARGKIRLRATGTSTCISAPAGSSGVDLQLAPCTTSTTDASQVFDFTANGEIKARGLCFDSEFGDPVDHRTLQLFTCKATGIGKSNQQYFLRGPIISDLNTCMTTPTTDFVRNDPLRSWSCGSSSNPDFTWDTYLLP